MGISSSRRQQATTAAKGASNRVQAASTPVRWARHARRWHKWTGALLSLVMALLSVSGAFVAYKKQVEYLQPGSRTGTPVTIDRVITPGMVAARVRELLQCGDTCEIDRIELRPEKFMYKVRMKQSHAFASPMELQIDAGTGAPLNLGVRGDQLWMDVHSLGVFGTPTKLIVMTLSGVSLLWLSLSGLYLFAFPRWFRANKRRLRSH